VSGPARVKVLYFAGSGRSGTTIINNIVGQLGGAFAAGEIRFLWERGVVEDRLCGCGLPFSQCPTWQAVMTKAFPDGSAPDANAVAGRLISRLRLRRLPTMIARKVVGRRAAAAHPDDEALQRTYDALAECTGASVILDSSKLPGYGLLLADLPGIDLYVLHIMRDPRAVTFSWRRTKLTHDGVGDEDAMQQLAVWKVPLVWLAENVATAMIWARRRDRYIRVPYERFVADPQGTMAAVADLVGLDPADLPFETPMSVRLAPTHSVAGNPNRHDTGTITLRHDTEWVSAMPAKDKAVVTALAAPGLLAFGYGLGASGRRRTS
jgi:Sulfotransferase family